MWHLSHVGQHEATLDVLAQADGQRMVIGTGFGRTQHIPEADHLFVEVRDLDPDGGFPGDRGQDADLVAADRIGDVVCQACDLRDLDGVAELYLVTGDCGAACIAGDPGVDGELLQGRAQLRYHPI